MTEEELKLREAALAKAGYDKTLTDSESDYSWSKTAKDPEKEGEWLYIIEWEVWDWKKHIGDTPETREMPYSMSLSAIANVRGYLMDMRAGDCATMAAGERLAAEFYEFLKKHFGEDEQ